MIRAEGGKHIVPRKAPGYLNRCYQEYQGNSLLYAYQCQMYLRHQIFYATNHANGSEVQIVPWLDVISHAHSLDVVSKAGNKEQ